MSYRTKGNNSSMPISLGIGLILAWMFTVAVGAIAAFLVAGERMPEDFIEPAAVITLCVSSFVGSMVAGGMMEQKRMIVCVVSGGIYYLSLICFNMLFFEGCLHGLLGAALTIMGSCVIAGLLQTRQKKQRIAYFKGSRKL